MKDASLIVNKTKKINAIREKLEENLLSSGYSTDSYLDYHNQLKKEFQKKKKQTTLFENVCILWRAARTNFWDPKAWESVLLFISSEKIYDDDFLAVISERAIANSYHCMTNAEMWELLLLFSERAGKSNEEIDEIVSKASLFLQSSQERDSVAKVFIQRLSIARRTGDRKNL
jgi:hypothetical protein